MKKNKRTKTAPKILSFLARNKPSSKWIIANTLNKSYGNTHAIVRQLLNLNLIKIEEKRPSAKNPKIEVEYYGLTLTGLIAALSEKESWKAINAIAKQQAQLLPLVFGKWDFFEKHGFKDLVIKRLLEAVEREARWVGLQRTHDYDDIRELLLGATKLDDKMRKTRDLSLSYKLVEKQVMAAKKAHEEIMIGLGATNEQIEQRITEGVLFQLPFNREKQKQQLAFLTVLKKDTELRVFVDSRFQEKKKQYEAYLEDLRSWKQVWDRV